MNFNEQGIIKKVDCLEEIQNLIDTLFFTTINEKFKTRFLCCWCC